MLTIEIQRKTKILMLLKTNNAELGQKEIQEMTGLRETEIVTYLDLLQREGFVIQTVQSHSKSGNFEIKYRAKL